MTRDIYWRQDRGYASRHRSEAIDSPAEGGLALLSILWRRKLMIVGTTVACLMAGLLYIVMTQPRYLASTSILIDPRLGNGIGADPITPGFVPDNNAMDSQIKLFTSQTVLTRVAKIANLTDDPEFNGSEPSLLQRILHPTPALVDSVDLKRLDEAITIKRPERTYVVTIDVLARAPRKAAEIANAITQAYIEDQISSRVDAARADTSFVSQRLEKLASAIKEAEDKVETYKINNGIVDANGLRSNEQQVSDLTKALGDARTKTSDAKAKLSEIESLAKRGRLDASSEALRSLTMERLRQQEAETEQNVAKLATTLGAQHPALVEAEGRQKKIEKLIRDELQRLKIAAAGDYQQALDHERQIAAEVKSLKAASASMSRSLVPLDALERNVRVLHASFDRFAQVNDNLSHQEAESPPGRVISVARPPVSPASPKKTIIGSISLAAGLFFGLAAALFAEGLAPSRPTAPSQVADTPVAESREPRPRAPRQPRRYWDDHDDDP